jgi:hypothetical protein
MVCKKIGSESPAAPSGESFSFGGGFRKLLKKPYGGFMFYLKFPIPPLSDCG